MGPQGILLGILAEGFWVLQGKHSTPSGFPRGLLVPIENKGHLAFEKSRREKSKGVLGRKRGAPVGSAVLGLVLGNSQLVKSPVVSTVVGGPQHAVGHLQ
jgi:hypothetical protein